MAKNSIISMLEEVVKNKITLYVIFFFATANAFGYLATSNYEAFIFFAVVLFVSKEFTNHIGLALLCAMISTNLLISIVQGRRVYETFVSGSDNAKQDKPMSEKQLEGKNKKKDGSPAATDDKDADNFQNDVNHFNKLEAMLSHQEGLVNSLDRIDNMIKQLSEMNGSVAAAEKKRNK